MLCPFAFVCSVIVGVSICACTHLCGSPIIRACIKDIVAAAFTGIWMDRPVVHPSTVDGSLWSLVMNVFSIRLFHFLHEHSVCVDVCVCLVLNSDLPHATKYY